MLNYYNEYLPDLARVAEPLRELTRKGTKFEWNKRREESFEKLKKLVNNDLKLAIFNPDCKTIVSTDASEVGIGGLLSQVQNGVEVPIAFGHHTLDQRQRNYSASEREALAAMYFCEYWEKYLLGRHFILRTDHQALKTLLHQFGNGRKSGKFARWFERLQIFNYTIEYVKGENNVVADAMSRLASNVSTEGVPDYAVQTIIKAVHEQGFTMKLFREASLKDDLHNAIREQISKNWPTKLKHLPRSLEPYYRLRDELSLDNDLIVRGDQRLLVSESLRSKLMKMAHSGHPGIVRMKIKLRQSYWWPTMNSDAEFAVRHCQAWQSSQKSSPKPPTEIKPPETSLEPWEKIAIDITGPFENAPSDKKFIVALIDYYSNFPEILCTSTITSSRIIQWLKEIFARYGNPTTLVSDNGPQFVSTEFENFLNHRGIRHHRTANYNPQENGKVEVFNRTLKFGVQAFMSAGTSWIDGLNELLAQFRSTPSQASASSPAELFLGRQPRADFELPRKREAVIVKAPEPEKAQEPQQRHPGPYKKGDKVRVRLPHVAKGRSPFSLPLQIVEILGRWTYKLSDGKVWNARKLRKVHSPPQPATVLLGEEAPAPEPRRSSRSTKGKPPIRFSSEFDY